MKTKILTLLTIFALLVPTAMAASTSDPKPFTVNFETTALDTSFSVQTKTDQLNFSSLANVTGVLPEGGNPWGNITNDGNVPLNFSVKLDALPVNVTLQIGSSDSDLIGVGTVATSPAGWTNVPATGSDKVDIVAKADYGTSTPGTESEQITIASAAATP